MNDLKDIRIRPGTLADADEVARVVGASWSAAYDGLLVDSALSGRSLEADAHQTELLIENGPPGSGVHIAESTGSIVGVSLFGPPDDGRPPGTVGSLYMLYTVSEAWGTAAGHRLFESTADAMRRAGLSMMEAEVLDSNERARNFFERQGMRSKGSHQQDWFGAPVIVVEYSMVL